MSGPKIDSIELERRRKEKLEHIRQERLRAIRKAMELLHHEISAVKTQVDQIDRQATALVREIEGIPEMEYTSSRIFELRATVVEKLRKILEFNTPSEPEAISCRTHALARQMKTIMADYNNTMKPLEKRIKDYFQELKDNKMREESKNLSRETYSAKAQIAYIRNHLSSYVEAFAHDGKMTATINSITDLKSYYAGKLENAVAACISKESDALFSCAHELAHETKRIMSDYVDAILPFERQIRAYNQQLENEKTETKVIDFDFNEKRKHVQYTKVGLSTKEKATQVLLEIEALINSESIQESEMKQLLNIANNIYASAFETQKSFDAAVIEFGVAKAKALRNMRLFDSAYQDYYAEYVSCSGLLSGSIHEKSAPREKYCFGSINELQDETNRLASTSKNVLEMNYIRGQIDEVMRLYGYNVSQEIIFGEGQSGNHFICERESNQSAIHLHISGMSGKKQLMMEVVGIGESRSINESSNVTVGIAVPAAAVDASELPDYERQLLLDEQGRFCDIHPRIVEELKRRGVVLSTKTRKTPDLKHCKRISVAAVPVESTDLNDERSGTQRRAARPMLKEQYRALKSR